MKNSSGIPILVSAACLSFFGILYAEGAGETNPPAEIRPLTLQEAVRMTLSRAPEVLVAEAQAIRAKEALRENRALNRPRIFSGTGLAYNNGFPLSIEGSAPSIIHIYANQAIFSKNNANLIREAEESRKAGQVEADSVRNEMAMRTATVYYELYQDRRIVEIAAQRLASAQKQQTLSEALLEAGRIKPVEATFIRTAVLSARQQLMVAREQASLAEKELHELTGLPSAVGIATAEPKINSPVLELEEEAFYQRALKTSPGILKAESAVRAKEFQIEAERGNYLPKLEVVGQYALFSRSNNFEDYFSRFVRNNFLVGLSIQVPIYNGGISPRVAQKRLEASEARYNLDRMKSSLKLDIQRGFGELRIAKGVVELGQSDLEAAREMLKTSEALIEAGRIGPKDLEDSRAQLQQKELSLMEADHALFLRKLELLRSSGSIEDAIQ
jgi:outer membrane protein TolC